MIVKKTPALYLLNITKKSTLGHTGSVHFSCLRLLIYYNFYKQHISMLLELKIYLGMLNHSLITIIKQ